MLGLRQYRSTAIDLWCGDITSFSCDVLVNATDESHSGSHGVDAAVQHVGGDTLLEQLKKTKKLKITQSIVTGAGNLPAERVIHSVGPSWRGGNDSEEELLTQTYHSALKIVVKQDWQHVAFPAIGAGSSEFPIKVAANIAMSSIKSFIDKKPPGAIRRITFVLFDTASYDHYQTEMGEVFGVE